MGISAPIISATAGLIEMKRMVRDTQHDDPIITKCSSCGSRDFREHAGDRICSFCRSEA